MKLLALTFAFLSLFAISSKAQVGSAYCFGISCPCGNDDPTAGCGNAGFDGLATTGALLSANMGTADVGADDLRLQVSGMAPASLAFFFMGGAPTSAPFTDGLMCVAPGATGLFRFDGQVADAQGMVARDGLVLASSGLYQGAQITAGSTWYFQAWYRDPSGPCGNQSNTSNGLPITFQVAGSAAATPTELAGHALSTYPFFDSVRAFNEGGMVEVGIDALRFPHAVDASADLYVVTAKSSAQWSSDASLSDVRGGSQAIAIASGGIEINTWLVDSGLLNGTQGTDIGIGYDVVLDLDQDGQLGAGDFIDGRGDEAGLYVVRDTTAAGPYAVIESLYSGGTWLGQDLYYPANIASLQDVPLIVISHGNGHNYQWYDHIGFHMASYGYIVMSHQNNTGPGITTASTTTITNTDYLLGNLATIEGGALAGHLDSSRITWLGHSRGAEGVVRAYDRLLDGTAAQVHYDEDDIALVSSIAPTVFDTFLGGAYANPHDVNYHLWTGSADADVSGGANCSGCQTYIIYERGTGKKASTTYQGAGHGAFHDGGGSLVATGPCLLSRAETHLLMKGYFLPLVKHMVEGDIPSKDFLWRQWQSFHPIGAPTSDCVAVNYEYQDAQSLGNATVDDYQTESSSTISSSGGSVTFTVTDLTEGLLDDNDVTFDWSTSDPMNGMTRAKPATDTSAGVVFSWDQPSKYSLRIPLALRDWSDDTYLSFRACQGTKHPLTTAVLGDLSFTITLRDTSGNSSSIALDTYGSGVSEPYLRDGGWANEFETFRIRLTDFAASGSGLNLSNVRDLAFEFGGSAGAAVGRIGLDEIELTKD